MANVTDPSTSSDSFAFGIFTELIFIWIILGNLIIIAVVKLYKPLTIPDILVFSLALSDLLNVLLPAQILTIIKSQLLSISWTKSLCATFIVLVYCLRLSSVLTVSVISLDRLIAVRKPLLYRSRFRHEIGRVKVLILTLWLFSCFTAVLPFMGVGEWSFKDNTCPYQLLDLGIYYGFCIEIIGFLQMALVLYCYVVIRKTTWHFLKRQGKFQRVHLDGMVSNPPLAGENNGKVTTNNKEMQMEGPKDEISDMKANEDLGNSTGYGQKSMTASIIKYFGSKRRESATPFLTEGMRQVAKMEKMMAVLVFLFYLSWIPFLGSNFYSLLTRKSNRAVTKTIGLFSLINGFLNPIVYATIYPRYRKGYIFVLRSILRICGGKRPNITTADFDSSKIGRSRRLQTVKELSAGTFKGNAAPQKMRQGWLKQTSSTTTIIAEEETDEMQSVKNNGEIPSLTKGDLILPIAKDEDGAVKVNRGIGTGKDADGVTRHTSVDCLTPNCVRCKGRLSKGSRHESRNVVSPTFVQITNLNPS